MALLFTSITSSARTIAESIAASSIHIGTGGGAQAQNLVVAQARNAVGVIALLKLEPKKIHSVSCTWSSESKRRMGVTVI